MHPGIDKNPVAVDCLATPDEIRMAMLRYPDPIEDYRTEALLEIAADVGGYVRLSAVEIRTSLLVEELIQNQDPEAN